MSLIFLRWTALRAVGNSLIARSTIIMPVIGSVLIYDDKIRALVGRALGEEVHTGVASLKLFAIYFGLFALGVGSVIYQLFCNETIKRFGTPDEYIAAVEPHVPRRRIVAMISEIRRSGMALVEFPVELILQQLNRPGGADDRKTRSEILDGYFEFLNESCPNGRIATALLYIIGIALISGTSLFTAGQVAVLAWTWVFGP